LVLRLGKAISRRRQYLRYHEDQQRNLEQSLGPYPIFRDPSKAPSEKIQSTVTSSIPTATKATASAMNLDDDDYYEDMISQTSDASSHSNSSRLRPPPLPKTVQDGEPFECPMNYRFTATQQTHTWHKHILSPLCTLSHIHSLLLTVDQSVEYKMVRNSGTGVFGGHATGTFASEDKEQRSVDLLNGIQYLGMKLSVCADTKYPNKSLKVPEDPINLANQNPPCNTLYVGNLPMNTSEDELIVVFSKQPGYRRLCFRTKQNGLMCFVEFENIFFATKALNELYGYMLHNSVKSGIRLSFSKGPLGVRSGQNSSMSPASAGRAPLLSPDCGATPEDRNPRALSSALQGRSPRLSSA
jgi:hypothetical protein